MAERRKVSHKANVLGWLDWGFCAHSCYNYERLQSTAFAQCMYWPLKDLYDTKEEIGRELEKHLTFFNTNPSWGGIINGVVVAMEEERANTGGEDSPVTADSIIAMKTGMMGPFAGLGDTIGQGILAPLWLSITITMGMEGNAFAPWLNTILMGICNHVPSYVTWMYGYKFGVDAVDKVLTGGMMDKVMLFAGILGCVAMGGLASAQVSVHTPIKVLLSEGTTLADGTVTEDTYMVVQTALFDGLFKGLLSLGAVLLTLGLMRKQVSAVKIILIYTVVGFACGALGILSKNPPM